MKDTSADIIEDLLAMLSKKRHIDVGNAILVLLNLSNPYVINEKGIAFYPNKHGGVTIPMKDEDEAKLMLDELDELVSKNAISNSDIHSYIRHNFTRFLKDNRKSNLGKYYTPEHLVGLVHSLVKPYVRKDSYVVDIAAGCGAFLKHFKDNKVIACDIDQNAVYIVKTLGFENAKYDNSLLNIDRAKYDLRDTDHIVIVGNPPYNDTTSRNKKYGKNAKQKINIEMDEDVFTNDLGISFLRAFGKLKANVICVLHPLSYLIKKANFTSKLGTFTNNYILRSAVVFSSREFSDTQKTPFPVVAALYVRDLIGMDYEYIRKFSFQILNDNKKFILGNIETIDGYIRKYPPVMKDKHRKSDIGLYMYNIRDINSLITTGNLTEKEEFGTHITINFNDLYKYAYLNCMKRYLEKDFRFGNLSPIVDKQTLENDEVLRDIFIIDTIVNNQKLSVFNVSNRNSIIYTKSLVDEYERKKNKYPNIKPDIYNEFLKFVKTGDIRTEPIKLFIIEYFQLLKKKMISENNSVAKPQP